MAVKGTARATGRTKSGTRGRVRVRVRVWVWVRRGLIGLGCIENARDVGQHGVCVLLVGQVGVVPQLGLALGLALGLGFKVQPLSISMYANLFTFDLL